MNNTSKDVRGFYQPFIPAGWVKSLNHDKIKLEKRLSCTRFQLPVADDARLIFSAHIGDSAYDIADDAGAQAFKTGIGLFYVSDATRFFEVLSGVAYSSNFPLDLDTWFQMCVLNLPAPLLSVLEYLIPQHGVQSESMIPLSVDVLNAGCASNFVWHANPSFFDVLFSRAEFQPERVALFSKQKRLRMELIAATASLATREYESLESGDILIPDKWLLNFDAGFPLTIAEQEIEARLVGGLGNLQLELLDVASFANEDGLDASEFIANLETATGCERLIVDSEEDDVEYGYEQDGESLPEYASDASHLADNDTETEGDGGRSVSPKVVIDACLGSFELDYLTAQNMTPGDLIKLNSAYSGAISLRSSGCEIGSAAIVSVNGVLALQIIKLWR